MKLSIVTAILNSHEIVRRQLIHYENLNLPDDVEIIFVDDGSEPALDFTGCGLDNFRYFATNDFRPWTQPAARNMGARVASGEFILATDIDHILSRELIETVRQNTEYDVIRFKRQAAILDENGDFTQDIDILRQYGLSPERGLKLPPHGNSYAIRLGLYLGLGGVSEKLVGSGKYPNREEQPLKRKLRKMQQEGKIKICDDDNRPMIYMFPNGKYCGDKNFNPFGLFHGLDRQRWWTKPEYA